MFFFFDVSHLKRGHQIILRDLRAECLLQVRELVRHHVANSPRRIAGALSQRRHHMVFELLLLQELRNGHARLHGQQSHRVLVVLRQVHKHRNDVRLQRLRLHDLRELSQFAGRRPSHHRRLVQAQLPETVAQLQADGLRDARITDGQEAAGRGAAGEPVTGDETLQGGHDVRLQVRWTVLRRDDPQRLHGLVADHGLLDGGQGLERLQQVHGVLGPTDETRELAELFGQGQQDLILVVDGLCEEGNEFGAGALLAQRQGDRGQFLDRVEAQLKG